MNESGQNLDTPFMKRENIQKYVQTETLHLKTKTKPTIWPEENTFQGYLIQFVSLNKWKIILLMKISLHLNKYITLKKLGEKMSPF